ncbi:MAG: hypothetical protein A2499_08500 [Stygiobacter sp. RIFOXYC12_FULL_38_8]|nr:MAG: hypothetical protein A2X62_02800 [Stygiobacter sp. GWC2_38_9]OGV06489.1 MAG: hypothetical protein A2299_02170 [Stygiobacter sp. RIFOXYB2_FULL_37_11]OGV10569.1 MAG: hypothetical protein A2237_18725 [Stygiobacter sp. RIFOXYA2_FULL_38_8]OGV13250.1 MAG: hypothetical protein A2440_13050 [Stygiobacter sp. RIFOXYC2_FULL_38_25]OGV25753.1 MAG: hypothetical protein A2499_08500 [Stygiobacter sp. RIFOXYC12_FULL_38_8]OGV83296.1 MAG: hypothetical protein A2X65_16605 [Stygiobacter sp. GWF2_38_21]RJQ
MKTIESIFCLIPTNNYSLDANLIHALKAVGASIKQSIDLTDFSKQSFQVYGVKTKIKSVLRKFNHNNSITFCEVICR